MHHPLYAGRVDAARATTMLTLPQILQTGGLALQFQWWAPVEDSGHFQSPEAMYSLSLALVNLLNTVAIYNLLNTTVCLWSRLSLVKLQVQHVKGFLLFGYICNVAADSGLFSANKCSSRFRQFFGVHHIDSSSNRGLKEKGRVESYRILPGLSLLTGD